jgi:hypothetical protein
MNLTETARILDRWLKRYRANKLKEAQNHHYAECIALEAKIVVLEDLWVELHSRGLICEETKRQDWIDRERDKEDDLEEQYRRDGYFEMTYVPGREDGDGMEKTNTE